MLDQQKGFFKEFRAQLGYFGVELDFVPREAHHKLGRAERHNAAWRGICNKTRDDLGIAGDAEVDLAAAGVTSAKNSLIRRAGASAQQAVFGQGGAVLSRCLATMTTSVRTCS